VIDPTALELARTKLEELVLEMQSVDQTKAMERLATVPESSLREALGTCYASAEKNDTSARSETHSLD
jgi:hypothetical protein